MGLFTDYNPLSTYWTPPKVATGRQEAVLALGGYKKDGSQNLLGKVVSWLPGTNLVQNEMARSYAAEQGLTDVANNIASDFDNRLGKLKTVGGVALGVAGAVTGQPQLIGLGASTAISGASGLAADTDSPMTLNGRTRYGSYKDGGGVGPVPKPKTQVATESTSVFRPMLTTAMRKSVDDEAAKYPMDQMGANAGGEFVRGWVRDRANARMAGLTPADAGLAGTVGNPTVAASQQGYDALYGTKGTTGIYYPEANQAIVRPSGDPFLSTTTATHEGTHQLQTVGMKEGSVTAHPAWKRTEALINQAVKNSSKDYSDDYLETPVEIHSRLMELRQSGGFKAGERVTPQLFRERIKRMTLLDESTLMDLRSVLDDKQIIELLDKTVDSTAVPSGMPDPMLPLPDDYFVAKDGGKMGGGIEYAGRHFPGYNKPIKSDRPGKVKMVLAKEGDKVKLIHFGDSTMGHNYSAAARASFKARHAKNIARGKMSAAWWADKILWAGPGGDTKAPPNKANAKYAEGGGYVGGEVEYYEDEDDTEDNWIIDKRTGQVNGELRSGELIFDQKASMKIDHLIGKGKLAELGRFVQRERATHKDAPVQKFDSGGMFRGARLDDSPFKPYTAPGAGAANGLTPVAGSGSGLGVGNYAGLAMDAIGAIGSAVGAGRKLPVNTVTPALQAYFNEISQRAATGMTTQEMLAAERAIDRTYQQQVGQITDIAGGGGSGAAVLAALGTAGRTAQDGRLNLELNNVDRKRQNLDAYGRAVMTQVGMDQANYSQAYNNAVNSRDAFGKSMLANLQQTGNRISYNEAYGPGSAYEKLMAQQQRIGAQTLSAVNAPVNFNTVFGK